MAFYNKILARFSIIHRLFTDFLQLTVQRVRLYALFLSDI